jgi:hypothetical protein
MKTETPTWGDMLEEVASLIGVVFVAGPPVFLLLGPWALIVLMLAAPFAVLMTLAVVVIAAMALVAAAGAILASPYLLLGRLVRHRRGRRVAVQASISAPSPRLLPAGRTRI